MTAGPRSFYFPAVGSDIDIADIIEHGELADWRRLRDRALFDSGMRVALLSLCVAMAGSLDGDPYGCWLAYVESVMDGDADGVVLLEVFADARQHYSPTYRW
ncbi:secretion protein HlyD family protein [Burkholderiales bacterium GJ-E10]|nr:secretion protein HlyD family protein [Burkholderiales bacterium GJ-E10]